MLAEEARIVEVDGSVLFAETEGADRGRRSTDPTDFDCSRRAS